MMMFFNIGLDTAQGILCNIGRVVLEDIEN